MRNLFTTKTALAIYAFAVAVITPSLPTIQHEVGAFVLRRTAPERLPDVSGLISVISVIAGTGLALTSKYATSGNLYTPDGLPGRDKPPTDR